MPKEQQQPPASADDSDSMSVDDGIEEQREQKPGGTGQKRASDPKKVTIVEVAEETRDEPRAGTDKPSPVRKHRGRNTAASSARKDEQRTTKSVPAKTKQADDKKTKEAPRTIKCENAKRIRNCDNPCTKLKCVCNKKGLLRCVAVAVYYHCAAVYYLCYVIRYVCLSSWLAVILVIYYYLFNLQYALFIVIDS